MEGDRRREKIIELLLESPQPVSGSEIAKRFEVSRQVIVQDIALLRATNKNILSTNKGYILYHPPTGASLVKRTFRVSHTDAQIQDELYTIVDCGGKVLDVVVEHDIYGQITADLILKNRQDVDEFISKIQNSTSKPLKELTDSNHFHTVEADTAVQLDTIARKLFAKGYLYSDEMECYRR